MSRGDSSQDIAFFSAIEHTTMASNAGLQKLAGFLIREISKACSYTLGATLFPDNLPTSGEQESLDSFLRGSGIWLLPVKQTCQTPS